MTAFFMPLLREAVQYDRGVGYFSSGWFRIAAQGMVTFAENGGRARWVTSPILDAADWEALQRGDAARTDALLYAKLQSNLQDIAQALEKETLSALAWMVADQVLDFRLAVPRNKLEHGNFHDKFGIFTDAVGNKVSFNGSYNDSIQGTRNYESIKTFCSWNPAFAPLVVADAERFDRLWGNHDPNVRVYDLPAAAREQILQLRQSERPYQKPPWMQASTVGEDKAPYLPVKPMLPPRLELRDYQEAAITAWFAQDCRGLLEMATGAGKTVTALAAAVKLYQRERSLALIVAAPYQHLVDQWHGIAESFGFAPQKAYGSRTSWLDPFNNHILRFNARHSDRLCVVTTYDTFSSGTWISRAAILKQLLRERVSYKL